jgi:hypothetical protein
MANLVGLLVPNYFPNAFEHDIGENKRQNVIQQPTQIDIGELLSVVVAYDKGRANGIGTRAIWQQERRLGTVNATGNFLNRVTLISLFLNVRLT